MNRFISGLNASLTPQAKQMEVLPRLPLRLPDYLKQQIKVALNPLDIIFLNFVESCILLS